VAEDERNRLVWAQALAGKAKVNVCWTMDVARWKRSLLDALQ
jgi:hypothetical protein